MNDKKQSIATNVVWRFAEQISAQFVSLLVSVILARLLSPEHYGTLAIITVLISFLQVFVDNGLGNALIQKKDTDELDFNSVFLTNIVVCIGLYGLLFLLAPFFARVWGEQELILLARVLGIIIIVSGVKNILQAYVAKNMMFRKFFLATLFGTIVSAVVGITMAYQGYGVWALVCQRLSNVTIDTIILYFSLDWKPKMQMSIKRVRNILPYSMRYTITVLLDVGFTNLRQLIIGKVYSTTDLAYFNQGEQFPQIIVSNINSSLDSVLFPAMSNKQEEKAKVKEIAKRTIRISSYLLCPMMVGLAMIAEELVTIILTEKWLECVPFLRIQCLLYMLYPIHTTNLNIIKAVGRTDIFLKIEILKIIVGMIGILCAMQYGIFAFAISMVITALIGAIINMYPSYRLVNYSIFEQIKDFTKNLLLATMMGFVVIGISYLQVNIYVSVIMKILCGSVCYLLLSHIFRKKEYVEIKNILLQYLQVIKRNTKF